MLEHALRVKQRHYTAALQRRHDMQRLFEVSLPARLSFDDLILDGVANQFAHRMQL